jgi:hypothetical protein
MFLAARSLTIIRNDVIGTSVDFDLNEIKYYKNGKDLGVAFRSNKFPTLHPCVSFYRGCAMQCNFGPTFKHNPLGFYGLNPTVNATQKKNLLNIFLQYHSIKFLSYFSAFKMQRRKKERKKERRKKERKEEEFKILIYIYTKY